MVKTKSSSINKWSLSWAHGSEYTALSTAEYCTQYLPIIFDLFCHKWNQTKHLTHDDSLCLTPQKNVTTRCCWDERERERERDWKRKGKELKLHRGDVASGPDQTRPDQRAANRYVGPLKVKICSDVQKLPIKTSAAQRLVQRTSKLFNICLHQRLCA